MHLDFAAHNCLVKFLVCKESIRRYSLRTAVSSLAVVFQYRANTGMQGDTAECTLRFHYGMGC